MNRIVDGAKKKDIKGAEISFHFRYLHWYIDTYTYTYISYLHSDCRCSFEACLL